MTCPHCESTATTERPDCTELGYRRFRCRACQRVFNERTGTPLNRLQYPTDVICLVVLWRFRYKLSLRDLAEMFLQRGIIFTHEAVRTWESKLAPLLSAGLRRRRHRQVGTSWYVDETYRYCWRMMSSPRQRGKPRHARLGARSMHEPSGQPIEIERGGTRHLL
jgi:putative transposase